MSKEKHTILCVEDEKELREDIVEELKKVGYEVAEVENGKDALEIISKKLPDIIISDVNMPEMDGYELMFQVKKRGANIPFVFLSSYADKKLVLKGYNDGVEEYICKPIDYNILIAKINAILKRVKNQLKSQTLVDALSLMISKKNEKDIKKLGKEKDV